MSLCKITTDELKQYLINADYTVEYLSDVNVIIMNLFKVTFLFPTDFYRIYGASTLVMDIVAKSQESAILKAKRTLPPKMREHIRHVEAL